MKKLSFMQNTIVLVLSNLITGSLGFMFSIVLSNEIGAQGVGLYQIIMPIYSLFICFTCGGTATALSKVVAEQNSRRNTNELYKSVSVSLSFIASWTIIVSIFLTLFAPFLSAYIMKDVRTYYGILVFIPALLFLAMGSVLKGYFYGMQNSTFPAVIDIVEKAVRIFVLVTLVTALKQYELKYRVAGAIAAMTAGEFTSFVLLYLVYKKSRLSVKQFTGTPDNVFQIIANVLKVSLPLCLNGFLSTMLGTFITVMIPRRLQDAGFTRETSLALFGKVNGMSMNIIMYPAIIIGAISTLLVPAISEASAGKSMSSVNRKMRYALKITTAVAAVSAGLFFSIPDELGRLFYNRNDLGNIIFSLSFGIIFSYIESTLFGILNGLGKQGVLLKNTMIMSAIDITVLYILLGIPQIGIYAIAVDFVVSPLAGCILNSLEIRKAADTEINIGEIVIFPLLLAILEAFAIINLKHFIFKLINNAPAATAAVILVGVGVFCAGFFLLSPLLKKSSM